jgi:hypothetical protein
VTVFSAYPLLLKILLYIIIYIFIYHNVQMQGGRDDELIVTTVTNIIYPQSMRDIIADYAILSPLLCRKG